MFNFITCPVVSNVSYKISYACNTSVPLLDSIGYTKISLVAYAYNISMYFVPLLLFNWERSGICVYNFTVLGSVRSISAHIEFVVSSLGGGKSVSISRAKCSLFVDLVYFAFGPNVPKQLLHILGYV